MRLKLVALATLSGVLLSLAWLGMSGVILWIAFVPLLYVDHYLVQRKNTNSPLIFWIYSLVTFILFNFLSTWWIWNATPAGAVFAILVNSFLMSLVWWTVHFAHRLKGSGFAGLILLFAWISFEYLHFKWDLSWPWLTLGNGLANDIKLIQWYEYTGVFGGSLWILIINLLVWNLVKKYTLTFENIKISQCLILIFVVFFPVIQSLIRFNKYNEKEDPVNIVLLQPNVDPYIDKFSGMSHDQQYQRLFSVADSLGNESVDFFVGPETALHEVWQNNFEGNKPIRLIKNFLHTKYPQSAFVVGATTFKKYSKENITSTARSNNDSTFIYDAFNTALLINKSDSVQMYHKSKLVSGVEKLPFIKYMKFLENMIVDLGGTTGTLATQNEPVVFKQNETIIGVPVCFESVFGAYVSQFINDGASLLFVITNDGWWDNTPGYRQHLAFARIQAIEFRRSIARSANTGISCFINQKGEIENQSRWWVKTSIAGKLNRNQVITFYAKHGDFIARISVFMFLMMGLSLMVTKLKRS